MQPAQLKSPNSPRRTIVSNINTNRRGFGNINLNSIAGGAGMSGMNDKIEKLSNLLKARGIKMPSLYTPTTTTPTRSGDYDGDDGSGGVVTYTRQQFEDLYKKNATRQSMYDDNGGGGYFDKLFFMFQLYIAFINALMNAANMSASVIFGNKSLQNLFSVFLVNVLNMILKTDVGNLTPEQLRDLLEKNRPVLQQISAIIIDEASQLLVGLSDVCKKIAMDWIENVVPGLVKSAAIGIPSALEAAIPPLGEVVEIVNTGLALMASFMKMVGAFQRNFDTVSQGYGHVKGAYDSLQKVRDLLGKDPSEIVKTATSAVASPAADAMVQNFVGNMLQPAAKTTEVSNTTSSAVASEGAASGGGGGSNRMKNRKYLKNTKHFNRYISNIRKKTAKKEVELINSIREFKSI
jgi:transcriptional regulator CtsR